MPLSIWEYLRQRTRDAVLAGFQDALDIAEQADTEGSQHDAAKRLISKLAGSPGDDLKQLPSASMNGEAAAPPPAAHVEAPVEQPRRPADASAFDADLESRLNAAASLNGQQTPPEKRSTPPTTGRRRRGRPPKNGGEKA
jgi:hypothetical protein